MASANHGADLIAVIPWVEAAILAAIRGEVPENVANGDAVPEWRERFSGKSLVPN